MEENTPANTPDKPPFPYPDGYYDRNTVIEIDGKTRLAAGDPPLIEWMEAHGLKDVTSITAEADKFTVTRFKRDLYGLHVIKDGEPEEYAQETPR